MKASSKRYTCINEGHNITRAEEIKEVLCNCLGGGGVIFKFKLTWIKNETSSHAVLAWSGFYYKLPKHILSFRGRRKI